MANRGAAARDGVGALAELAHIAATERAGTVAQAVARHLSGALGSDSAVVFEYGGTPGRLTVTASHGIAELQPGGRTPASRLLTPLVEPLAASIIDASERAGLPGAERPRSLLCAPIPGPYAPTGSIAAFFGKPRDFTDDDIALARLAASLIGAAQQKEAASSELAGSLGSRVETTPARSREHAVLAGMARAAAESPDLKTALASICEWTAEAVPYDRMVIGLVDHEPPGYTRAVAWGEKSGDCKAGERYLLSADELEELSRPATDIGEPACDRDDVASSIRAPVLLDGKLIGVMWLGANAADGYSEAARESLCRVADYAAPFIDAALKRERAADTVRAVSESSQQLAAVLSAAPVALVAVDAAGMCTMVEGRLVRDLGIYSDLIMGHSLFELTGRHPEVEEAVRAALRGIPGTAGLHVGRRYIELSVRPVLAKGGGIGGAIIVGADVTDRAAGRAAIAEVKQLHRAQDERARLMSAVSHELKTPLTSIVAFIDILAANQPGNLTPEQAQALSVVQKSAERLGRLIGDLHDLSRMEAGIFTLEVKNVEVGSMLEYLHDTYQPLMAARRQTLKLENGAGEWQVTADELRLSQAVSNLLSNASKYSPEGSEVRLAASIAGGSLELTVSDAGPGIPDEFQKRVFDAGYRIDNDHTRSTPGSGLGLAIVKRIVDLHGGQVDLRGGPGHGTIVSIRIPGARRVTTVAANGQPAS